MSWNEIKFHTAINTVYIKTTDIFIYNISKYTVQDIEDHTHIYYSHNIQLPTALHCINIF